MNNSKVLFIEDYEDDYLLLMHHVKKNGFEIQPKRIKSKDELVSSLDGNWDAIICDNRLPGFNAREALKIVRDVDKDVPFIIVSGSLTDLEATEAMREGASDYIIKGDYTRFLPALQREIRDYHVKLRKKEIEATLIQKEEAFSLLTENAQDLFLLTDDDGIILYVSNSVKYVVGHQPCDVLGKNCTEFIHEDDVQKFIEILKEIKQGAMRTYRAVYKVFKPDGSIVHLENMIKPIVDGNGNKRLVSTSRNIEEILEYRAEVSDSNKRAMVASQELTQLIKFANAPIFGISMDGIINEWNPFAEKLTGYTKEDLFGDNPFELLIPRSYQKPLLKIIADALHNKEAQNYEVPIFTKDGKELFMMVSATPRRNLEGKVVGVICYGQDITERKAYSDDLEKKVKERTKQLKESLEKEKELASLKTRFVSMASHEFKTPISTISFATEFIERYYDKAPKERVMERLQKIKQQINNMVYLLNDVLTYGKESEQKINTNIQEVNLQECSRELIEEIGHKYSKHRVDVSFSGNPTFATDKMLMRNICNNLLINAMKYSPDQKEVRWGIKNTEKGLYLRFEDNGIGIPEEDQPKIFDPFHRSGNVNEFEGTGLGLSIVKRSADSLNGNVYLVESSPEGTVFECFVPTVCK